jgi:arylsulfatase A
MMAGAEERPNILLIYLDDMGYGDPGCYNPDSKILTPNIDRLAKEGLRFTDAHTAASICGPSRYGLMSGRYPWRRGPDGRGNGPKFRDLFFETGCTTMASVLKDAGYNTAQIGKWGIRHNYSAAVKPGMEPGTKQAYDFPAKRLLGAQAVGFDYSWCQTYLFPAPGRKTVDDRTKNQFENGLPVDPDLTLTDPYCWLPSCGEKTVEYLEAYAGKTGYEPFGIDREKPFFIYLDPPAPHEPVVPNPAFVGKSAAGAYGDFVMEVDDWIGNILETLDREGLTQNTLVIFSSDNGPEKTCYERAQATGHYSMGALRGSKREAYEGGHRVPLIVRWPGVVEPGRVTDQLTCMTDWYATVAEITGLTPEGLGGEDSESLLPVLRNTGASARDSIIHHSSNGHYALRQGDWIYIDHKTGSVNEEPEWFRKERGVVAHSFPAELFNLKDDPQQTRNLYAEYPEKANVLKALLDQYRVMDHSRK